MGVVAFHVENNDSQLMGIKKQEYLRVLAGIMNESRQAQARPLIGGGGGSIVYVLIMDLGTFARLLEVLSDIGN